MDLSIDSASSKIFLLFSVVADISEPNSNSFNINFFSHSATATTKGVAPSLFFCSKLDFFAIFPNWSNEKLKSLTKEESFDVMYSQIFDENGDIKNRQLLNRFLSIVEGLDKKYDLTTNN